MYSYIYNRKRFYVTFYIYAAVISLQTMDLIYMDQHILCMHFLYYLYFSSNYHIIFNSPQTVGSFLMLT